MSRFTVTRSPATVVMATLVTIALGLAASVPFTAVRPMTALYVAMLVTGISMFLRERVFVPTRVAGEAFSQPSHVTQLSTFAKLSDSGAHR